MRSCSMIYFFRFVLAIELSKPFLYYVSALYLRSSLGRGSTTSMFIYFGSVETTFDILFWRCLSNCFCFKTLTGDSFGLYYAISRSCYDLYPIPLSLDKIIKKKNSYYQGVAESSRVRDSFHVAEPLSGCL